MKKRTRFKKMPTPTYLEDEVEEPSIWQVLGVGFLAVCVVATMLAILFLGMSGNIYCVTLLAVSIIIFLCFIFGVFWYRDLPK